MRSTRACRSLRPVPRELPSFDLVVATVGRADELGRLLDSLEAQDYPSLRVVVVDQNDDLRAADLLAGRPLELVHLQSETGLSRARNVALEHVSADVVAFPDDDCVYPPGLLAARRRAIRATTTRSTVSRAEPPTRPGAPLPPGKTTRRD